MAILKTITELNPGDKGTIEAIDPACSLMTRLQELGLLPGTPFEFIRRAPWGDPLEIKVRGSHLCLRKDEASFISVSI
ncbi:MAG: ferrous iron transport protein A [Verrucomicrobia bacterium CG_4_10_14_3_um_filter_43_23]|nr:MAG: hypothetical protein AUJ82_02035 [Verrucomicrobia bacterium CG1_02_43_26]PIP59673.1 MAG: ferrous iron transport protein A [Verrucomicrobia bacterium CG22_combo_CG10-13_8_21_14_all_43_17]PIX58996.1 MAG: ferrous iron transport protein A [Verrucomicrobia bacterium CG_4_10_14_3_um_filter_43_23]PIY63117.1 MAG: ferrous iron transport protein A [Verrucomicrobia bacterium CG_4_10_14_0_8_um_filter_43_34]PJA43625.1 MAG: ferrous iron transport protein A [Verrucomicrobia bacterium CG_4_9_14_3_um_fi